MQQQTKQQPRRGVKIAAGAVVSVLAAWLWAAVSYPGIMYSDSYTRLGIAQQMADGTPLSELGSYLSLLPQFFIAACLRIAGSAGAYIWLQAAFFYAVLLAACFTLFKGKAAWAAAVVVLLCPMAAGYAVYWETSVVTTGGLLLLVLLAGDACTRSLSWRRTAGYAVASAALSFVVVGYRLNAATAICGVILLLVIAVLRKKQEAAKAAVLAAALAVGILAAYKLPKLAGMAQINNGVVGPVWETACMLDRIGPGNGYDTYLDDLLGEGQTEKLFAVENPEENMYSFADVIPYFDIPWSPHTSGEYMARYTALIRQQPKVFLQMKASMIRHTLGLLPLDEYDYDRNDAMASYGMQDTAARRTFYNTVTGFINGWHWGRTPWMVLLTALVLLVLCAAWHCVPTAAVRLLIVAVCYEGAFFITTQSHEFRYWFPALVLLLYSMGLMAAAALQRWAEHKGEKK